jgi:hypothetical protein
MRLFPQKARTGLDFSGVTSREKAEALHAQGKLERVLLFPAEFGGEDIPGNVVFVPLGITEIKDSIDRIVAGLAADGAISNVSVTPEYKSRSFVPTKMRVRAWHPDKEAELNQSIVIWP